jgi:hypothetical protein
MLFIRLNQKKKISIENQGFVLKPRTGFTDFAPFSFAAHPVTAKRSPNSRDYGRHPGSAR